MSSGRIINIPVAFRDYLQKLDWWDERIAVAYIQLIDIIINTVQCQTTLSGNQKFFLVSKNEEEINRFLHETLGKECNIAMCIERVRGHTYNCCEFHWCHD